MEGEAGGERKRRSPAHPQKAYGSMPANDSQDGQRFCGVKIPYAYLLGGSVCLNHYAMTRYCFQNGTEVISARAAE